jgi:ryanodine receptor 2
MASFAEHTGKFGNQKFLVESWFTIFFDLKEEKLYSGSAESFGKQWQVGDVVGVFLDLIDRTISKSGK